MRHATALLYHVYAVASRNIMFASCGTSGKLTLCYVFPFPHARGSVVVKALYYKPEGRGFDTQRGDFFKFTSFRPH
jgi:hypothetical protein